MNHEDKYLKIPLNLTHESLDKISLRESISQFVGIIIGSRFGSFPFDPVFGCRIWEREYTHFSIESQAEFRGFLRNAISTYEKRLKNVSVNIIQAFVAPNRNKASLVAQVKGIFMEDGEERSFEEEYVFWQPRWQRGRQR